MKNKQNFFMKMISSDHDVSSKRIITFVAFILMAIGFIMNLFFKYTIDPNIYDSMKWIVIGGLGFVASESFSNMVNKPKEEEPDYSQNYYPQNNQPYYPQNSQPYYPPQVPQQPVYPVYSEPNNPELNEPEISTYPPQNPQAPAYKP